MTGISKQLFVFVLSFFCARTQIQNPRDKTCVTLETMLDAHNDCRTNGDCNTAGDLEWSDTLADQAANHLLVNTKCPFPKSLGSSSAENFVGEFSSVTPFPADANNQGARDLAKQIIDGWCAQGTNYDLSANTCGGSSDLADCAEYLQIVNMDVTEFGCSFQTCDDTTNITAPRAYVMFCLYDSKQPDGCRPCDRSTSGDPCENTCTNVVAPGTRVNATASSSYDYYLETITCDASVNSFCFDRLQRYFKINGTGDGTDQFLGTQTSREQC